MGFGNSPAAIAPLTATPATAGTVSNDINAANSTVAALQAAVAAARGSLSDLPQYVAPPSSAATDTATAAAQAASTVALQQQASLDTALFMAQYGRMGANSGINVSPLGGGRTLRR